MELRHMRYFVVVAEHLNFGRAAEALLTAQPSLSRQIQQLEEDAGGIFLTDARRTLKAADASVRHVRENAEEPVGNSGLALSAVR